MADKYLKFVGIYLLFYWFFGTTGTVFDVLYIQINPKKK